MEAGNGGLCDLPGYVIFDVIFDVGPSDRDAMKPHLDKAFDTLKAHGGVGVSGRMR
jgi:hypothetical protein